MSQAHLSPPRPNLPTLLASVAGAALAWGVFTLGAPAHAAQAPSPAAGAPASGLSAPAAPPVSAPSASAAATPPILDDTDQAGRLEPAPAFGAVDGASADSTPPEPEQEQEQEQEQEPLKSWTLVSAHTRYISIPQAALGVVYDTYTSFRNVSAGLAVDFGSPNKAFWTVELDWSPVIPKAGNWKRKDEDNASASYAFSKQHMISADVTYRRSFDLFSPNFHWLIGGGAGIGFLIGDIQTSEVLPTCQAPVSDCAHWELATTEAVNMPTRIIPVLHVTTGLQFDFGDKGMIRFEGGFRNVLYLGLAGGMTL